MKRIRPIQESTQESQNSNDFTLPLIDLPQHILSDIITYTVQDTDPDDGLDLRRVNKVFNREVLHAYFEREDIDFCDLYVSTPNTVTIYRFLRGYILCHDNTTRLPQFRKDLYDATQKLAKYLTSRPDVLPKKTRFSGLYETKPNEAPIEEAVAIICETLIDFMGSARETYRMLSSVNRYWEDDELDPYDNILGHLPINVDPDSDDEDDDQSLDGTPLEETSRPDYDITNLCLVSAGALLNDLELVKTSFTALRAECTFAPRLTANIYSTLRLPILYGAEEIVNFILDQPELVITPGLHRRKFAGSTIFETAVEKGPVSLVKQLHDRGCDTSHSTKAYCRGISAAIKNDKDGSVREQLIEFFLDITDEWRSGSMVSGIVDMAFRNNRPDVVKQVIEKVKTGPTDVSDYDWEWTDHWRGFILSHAASCGVEAIRLLRENQSYLPESLKDLFDIEPVIHSMETAIVKAKHDVLAELLPICLENSVTDESSPPRRSERGLALPLLLALATIKGDLESIKLLVPHVDLHHEMTQFRYYRGPNPAHELLFDCLSDIEQMGKFVLNGNGNVTWGSICLFYAIKSLRVDNARFFLEQGFGIGTRMIYMTRNFQAYISDRLLIRHEPDEQPRIGKWACVLTLSMVDHVRIKHSLETGAELCRKGIVITRNPTGRGIKIMRCRTLRKKSNVKVLSAFNIPTIPYERDRDGTDFNDMNDLLSEYRHPWIYSNPPDPPPPPRQRRRRE